MELVDLSIMNIDSRLQPFVPDSSLDAVTIMHLHAYGSIPAISLPEE